MQKKTIAPGFALETERLLLRELTRSDLDALHAVLGDVETMQYYAHPHSREETQRWIEWSLDNYARLGHGLWAMTLKDTGELIGDCGLTIQYVDGAPFVEVGWHTHRDHWNKGYATEGGRASRDWAFENLTIPFLISIIRPENVPSWRVAEKLGLTISRTTFRGPDNAWEHRVYRITRDEWEKLRAL
ncbi:MAG: GNAT family N-acetyltransferase [Actinomycetota bacterium]